MLFSSLFKPQEAPSASEFLKPYEIVRELGRGGFSVVYLAKEKETGREVSIKIIKKSHKMILKEGDQIDSQTQDKIDVKNEYKIQKQFTSPYIVDIYGFYEDENEYIMVMEYVDGGDLFRALLKRGRFTERDCAKVIQQVLLGLKILHENHVIHRDLKPENLLMKKINDSDDDNIDNYVVKIADFGLSDIIARNQKMEKYCGTEGYAAPEIIKNVPYNESADIWSLGCITYCLLSGRVPFPVAYEENEEYKYGELDFPSPEWDGISEDAKEFIRYFLNPNPNLRMSINEALNDIWIRDLAPLAEVENFDIQEHLKQYHVRRKMKRVLEKEKIAKRLSKLLLLPDEKH